MTPNDEGKVLENKNKIQYKRATEEDTQHLLFSMQNPPVAAGQQSFHPHLDISTSHNLQNSIIHAKLSSASLSITSPDARITEFNYNSSIPDSYYAKVYLPNATLTGYKHSSLRTAEGCAFACVYFDPRDPRIFDLAGLNAPEPEDHVPSLNDEEASTRPQSPTPPSPDPSLIYLPPAQSATQDPRPLTTGSTHGAPSSSTMTNCHATSVPTVSQSLELHDLPVTAYHVTATLPPVCLPDSLKTLTAPNSLPTFLQHSGRTVYKDLFAFGSHPAGDQVAPDDENMDEYTHVEWLFLMQVLDYC